MLFLYTYKLHILMLNSTYSLTCIYISYIVCNPKDLKSIYLLLLYDILHISYCVLYIVCNTKCIYLCI